MNIMTPIGLASAGTATPQFRAVSLELRELRAFVSVARNGNVGRAARELELSQPTVSHQVQRLEDAVGTPLLLRHGRGVTLTPAGTALLDRLDVVAHLLDVPLPQDLPPDSVAGCLRIGVAAELAPVLLPPLVQRLRAEWPRLRLEVREACGAQLEEWALTRRVDVAVLQDPPALDSLRIESLLSEPLGLVAGARSRLAEDDRPVRLRELAGVSLILPGEQHWIRRKLANAAFQHGVRLRPELQIEGLASLKQMVRSGLGCTILPRVAVQDEIARGSLAFRRIEQPALVCTHAIAWSDAADTPVAALAALTRQEMTALARDGAWFGADMIAQTAPARLPEAWTWSVAEQPQLVASASA